MSTQIEEIAEIRDGTTRIVARYSGHPSRTGVVFNVYDGGTQVAYIGLDMFTSITKAEFATAILRATDPDRLAVTVLPTEPGTVITWRDGAYLPQLAQLDPGEMRLGWRYTDDTGGYWLTPGEMLAQIGDVEYTVLGVSA